MTRLIERVGEDRYKFNANYKKIWQKLLEYEELEEQGLFVRLPCKIGDKVWYVDFCNGNIREDVVLEFSLENDDWYVRLRNLSWVILDMFKINFYLTKEDAEKKLKKLKGR